MGIYISSFLPWAVIIILLILVAVVDWERAARSILRLILAIVVVVSGIGYYASSRLAGWLPRWFPGQGTLSTISGILGLVALATLVVLIDWKRLWRKRKWQLVIGVELALLLFVYAAGLYALIPGASGVETQVQNWLHLKPLTAEIVSARAPRETSAPGLLSVQPKGELLVITVKVTNTSKEPRYLLGGFELFDIQGRRFDMQPASLLGAIDFFNPGLSSAPTLAFDVPSAHGLWWLNVYPDSPSRLGAVSVPFLVP